MKNLLILGASELQIALINKGKSLGYNTIAIDMNNQAPGASVANEFYPISTIDSDKILLLAQEKKIVGIVTTSDFPVRTVALVCKALGLHGVSVEVAEICTNKFLQREILKNDSFLYPRFQLIKNEAGLNPVFDWELPLIIKPIDSSASRGVQKITNISELADAYKHAFQNSKSKEVIVEEFIEGREYSVEILVQNNIVNIITITEKFTSGETDKFFVEEIHIVPADLDLENQKKLESEVTRFVNLIGLNNSAAHVEAKINSKGVFIIEIAARLGGDFITTDLVPLATGVDMLKEIISISTGESIHVTKKHNYFAGIHFLSPQNYEDAILHLQKNSHSKGIIHTKVENKKMKVLIFSFN